MDNSEHVERDEVVKALESACGHVERDGMTVERIDFKPMLTGNRASRRAQMSQFKRTIS